MKISDLLKRQQPAPKKEKQRRHALRKDLPPMFEQPTGAYTADSAYSLSSIKGRSAAIPPQAEWFMSQGFIGYQLCAHIAKHWIVDKACNMPARDAVRMGWKLSGVDDAERVRFERQDARVDVSLRLRDLIRMGRAYGGQLALFDIATDNPLEYYEAPFNKNGVQVGSYRGIVLIDPVDATPIVSADTVQDPANPRYMEPTFWLIGGRKYHHSHLMRFVPYPVTKLARHRYNYFGVSVPERIYERVYCAESVANEAPRLTMTKRLVSMAVPGLEDADQATIFENMEYLTQMRDNFGVLLGDSGTTISQLETSLADLDATIMTQYQLIAAAAGVPATKLLETTPKGFNATGEYEAASYREMLESIQTNDLEPLLNRHYQISARHLGLDDAPTVQWNPLNSPTAAELADLELKKAQTDQALSALGAIDGFDVRGRISEDKDGAYYGIELGQQDDVVDEGAP